VTIWRTRLAPTPSGYLHEGNALNFLLIHHLKEKLQAKIVLRIDDLDQDRVRDHYIEDIFETLKWMGIEPDEGLAP
jgi:glutamyl-tRNA synthetase